MGRVVSSSARRCLDIVSARTDDRTTPLPGSNERSKHRISQTTNSTASGTSSRSPTRRTEMIRERRNYLRGSTRRTSIFATSRAASACLQAVDRPTKQGIMTVMVERLTVVFFVLLCLLLGVYLILAPWDALFGPWGEN